MRLPKKKKRLIAPPSPTASSTFPFVLSLLLLLPFASDTAKVITLGDSYSSGTGIHPLLFGYDEILGASVTLDDNHGHGFGKEDNSRDYENTSTPPCCLREKDTTPGARLAHDLGLESYMGACAGAQFENLYDQIDYMNALFPDDYQDQWDGSTILLTLGLNNLESVGGENWFTVLSFGCLLESDCSTNSDYPVANQENTRANLMAALSYLTAEASRAIIRVFGYGKPFQGSNSKTCDAFGMSNAEADFIDNDYFGLMNAISKDVVTELQATAPVPGVVLDIEFIDVTTYLTVVPVRKMVDISMALGLFLRELRPNRGTISIFTH